LKTEGQKQSQKHEKRLAKAIGGTRNAGSGSFWSRKGDVRSDDLLIEHKYTGNKQYTLKAVDLEKNVTHAVLESRMPVFGISLNNKNYVILTEDDFLEMREKLQDNG
jgi:hypothetical protein